MKKRLINGRTFQLIMKFGFIPIFLSIVLADFVVAGTTFGQELLAQRITLEADNIEVRAILKQIEKQTHARFIYSPQVISASHKVRMQVTEQGLSRVLDILLRPLNITYRVNGQHIVLNRLVEESSQPEQFQAQPANRKISGLVVDEKDIPLPGVNIILKGGQQGTVTDVSGNFQLTIPEGVVTLIFSYIGYLAQEVVVDKQSSLAIKLLADTKSLDEVLVVGYGNTTRRDLTGSVSSISSADFRNHPMNDFSQVLQGRAPGLVVSNTTGSPGQSAKMRIRGANSLSGGNDPLIIIDGVPSTYDINVNDIKSVEILKDASATAIYGSRGANGVILITTQRGDANQPKINVTSNVGISHVNRKYDLLGSVDYAKLTNTVYGKTIYTDAQIQAFAAKGGTDWQDQVFRSGLSQNYQLSASGGGKTVKYLVSGNYINEKGTLVNTDRKKYAFRTNLSADFSKRFSMSFDINAQRNERHNPELGDGGGKTNPIYQSLLWSPTEPVYNEDGTYKMVDTYGALGKNPVLLAREPNNNSFYQVVSLNTNLKYQILNGLTFNGIASINKNNVETRNSVNANLSSTTSASRSFTDILYWQLNALLTYDKKFFEKHSLSVMAGFEEAASETNKFSTTGNGITDYYNIGSSSSVSSLSNYGYYGLKSYFGRVNYNFNSRYYLTATYRADGSSKFKDDNKWGFFPSMAVNWLLSEEEFVKNLGLFDNLKLRGSWGVTGNQAISPYATLSSLGTASYTFASATKYTGTTSGGLANTGLRWEETTQQNVGLDMTILKGRMSLTVDYFTKQTRGVLLSKQLPRYDGGYKALQNLGRIDNKGIEFSLDYLAIEKKDFNWRFNFNLAALKNKVIDLGGVARIFGQDYGAGVMNASAFAVETGQPLGSFWGMEYLGIWDASEKDKALTYGNKPGDSKYEDINNDGKIDASDYHIIGNANPKFTWGFSNSFSYKNLGLDILLQGLQGRDVYNITYASAAVLIPDARTITLSEASKIWTPTNTNAAWPAVSTTNTNYMNSSRWLQNGSYLKVRNISLYYLIPKRVSKFGDLKISVSGQNLFTITKYRGFDPEVSSSGTSDIDSAIDFGVYPTSRLVTTGITLTF
jgi:TonB-dependent starch-binding outer membrane protein SusC